MHCCNNLHQLCHLGEKDLLCMIAKKVEILVKDYMYASDEDKAQYKKRLEGIKPILKDILTTLETESVHKAQRIHQHIHTYWKE